MLKPEQLLKPLNAVYKLYLDSTDPETIATNALELEKEITRFLDTNLIYWKIINASDVCGTVFITENQDYLLADFVTHDDVTYKVPVRRVKYGADFHYALPSVFPEGVYHLGELVKSLDASGNICPLQNQPSGNDLYWPLLSCRQDIRLLNQVVSDVWPKVKQYLIPLHPKHNLYELVGRVQICGVMNGAILAVILPNQCAGSLYEGLDHSKIGITTIQGKHYLVKGIHNALYEGPMSDLNNCFVHDHKGCYRIVEVIPGTQGLVELIKISRDEFEEVANEDSKIAYLGQSVIRVAQ